MTDESPKISDRRIIEAVKPKAINTWLQQELSFGYENFEVLLPPFHEGLPIVERGFSAPRHRKHETPAEQKGDAYREEESKG